MNFAVLPARHQKYPAYSVRDFSLSMPDILSHENVSADETNSNDVERRAGRKALTYWEKQDKMKQYLSESTRYRTRACIHGEIRPQG